MVGALNDISWIKDAFREDGFSEHEVNIDRATQTSAKAKGSKIQTHRGDKESIYINTYFGFVCGFLVGFFVVSGVVFFNIVHIST